MKPKRRFRAISTFVRTVVWATLPMVTWGAGASPQEDTVLVPIPSINVIRNSCNYWLINLTYTATALPRSTIDVLRNNEGYSVSSHYHIAGPEGTNDGGWYTALRMSGSPETKLGMINKTIYGTPNPHPGETRTREVEHNGGCAADRGKRECVGVFISPVPAYLNTPDTYPTTLPDGLCVGIPPANTSCSFDRPQASIDLGTGGRGTRTGSTTISYSCTRPTTFRVSMNNQAHDPAGIHVEKVLFDGKTLPATGTYSEGVQNAQVDVEAVVTKEGSLATNRVLFIEIP